MDILRRWKEHAWSNGTSPVSCAIRKHGVDAFDFEVIAESTQDRIKELEEWHIFLHDCLAPRGYNLLATGDGATGHDADTRARLSQAHRGKVLSEATRAKMSASRMGEQNPNFGKVGATCQAVTQYSLDGSYLGEFPSQHLAAQAIGDVQLAGPIGHACTGVARSAGGHLWRRSEGAPDSLPPYVREAGHPRTIVQLSHGVPVGEPHPSVKAAAEAVGAKPPNISAVLSGKLKRCKGFEWQYADGGSPAKRMRRSPKDVSVTTDVQLNE